MTRIEAYEYQLARTEDREYATYLEGRIKLASSDQLVAAPDAPPATCGQCGADVRTERLFSEHFVIPNPQYPNLGDCPNV